MVITLALLKTINTGEPNLLERRKYVTAEEKLGPIDLDQIFLISPLGDIFLTAKCA